MALNFKIITWSLRLVTLALGVATSTAIYMSAKKMLSARKSYHYWKENNFSENLNNSPYLFDYQLWAASTVASLAYLSVVLLALIKFKTYLYECLAVLTFILGLFIMFPSAAVSMGYHPDSWPTFLGITVALFLFTAAIYWAAKYIPENDFRET